MFFWYIVYVFYNKSIKNSMQYLKICKIWGQKWHIGNFLQNPKNRVFSILCHLHPTPRGQKKKCFPDHSYVIVIWCTYIFNKTIKNGLLCLKIYKIWGQKFKIGHFCWNDINIVNEKVHNYYCYLLLFHLIYCFYCSIMCLKTYLLCQLCAE